MTAGRALAAIVGLVLVIGSPAAGSPTWEAPVQVSTGDRALGLELALNDAGAGLAVWDQEVGAECPTEPAALSCIHVVTTSVRSDRSLSWSAPIEISRPGVGARPRAAIDQVGNAAIVWVHDIGRDRVVQATYRRGPAGTWPEPNDISEASLEVRNHEIALDAAGNAIAVWAERVQQVFDAYAVRRSAATGVWGAPVRLSSVEWRASSGPDLSLAPTGRIATAWVDHNDVVWVSLGDSTLGAWEPRAALTDSAGSHKREPAIAINAAGDTAAVWVREAGAVGEAEVFAAFRQRSGGWSSPLDLGSARAITAAPQVAVDDAGGVVVVWLAPAGVAAATRSASGGWKGLLLSALRTASDPHLALSSTGNAVAVWTTRENGVVQGRIRPGTSGTWQPRVDVSGTAASARDVAMDSAGNAFTIWNRISGQRVNVEIADLAGNGPVLERLRVPSLAMVVRVRRPFSVEPVAWAAPLTGEPRWSFGDGSEATGRRVGHGYTRTGRFTVTVSQADGAGDVSTAAATIRVIRAGVRNIRPPSIRGTPRVGRTLTCLRGVWSGSPPITFRYSWRRDGQISGVTTARYRLRRLDAGSLIACEVVATNPAGSRRASSGVVGVEPGAKD